MSQEQIYFIATLLIVAIWVIIVINCSATDREILEIKLNRIQETLDSMEVDI